MTNTHTGDIDCIICGTCVADILVRPVPLSEPTGGGRLFHVEPIEATTRASSATPGSPCGGSGCG